MEIFIIAYLFLDRNMQLIFYIILIIICLNPNLSAQNETNKRDPPIIYDFQDLNIPAIPMIIDNGQNGKQF